MRASRSVFLCGALLAAGFPALVALAASVATKVIVTVIPNAPTALSAAAISQTQAGLSWTDDANNEDGFSIERSVGSDAAFTVIATTAANIAVYSDTGLSPSTLYYYRVSAFNADGVSAYSNEASTTTSAVPLPPPGNGGGGGGGGGFGAPPPIFQTGAVFKGIAYPSSNVTLLANGQVLAVTQSGPDAQFEVDLSDIGPGTYNFGVGATDPSGNRSITQTFQVTLANGATTVISGIFFPPTIGADKIKVKRGDLLTIIGYTAPQATVTVIVHSDNPVVTNVTSSDQGAWIYKLSTDLLAMGDHSASARALAGGNITTDSALITFAVGNENVAAPAISTAASLRGDINGDGKVNLIDFSIMAYWFRRPHPPAIIDLNGDGVVNLIDFSILAYYWTG